MRFWILPLALVVLGFTSTPPQQGSDQRSEELRELAELQERAETILSQNQKNEITTSEARRKVQLLLKDLEKWSVKHDVELERLTRTFSSPAVGSGEILTADRCPLFFEEKLERLCPLDLSRSEVWGVSIVFCRYRCAPETKTEEQPESSVVDRSEVPQPER